MCTSIVVETLKGHHHLARTMDFAFELNGEVIIIPRNYTWQSVFKQAHAATHLFGFVGTGRSMDSGFIFADGINEKGLSCASLYFPEYAHYEPSVDESKINLAPHEVVYWLLSHFSTVEEVANALKTVHLVNEKNDLLGIVMPLHWVISDQSGRSIVVEPTVRGIEVFENTIGVMSNSPNYEWHLTNIRNYIGIQSKQSEHMHLYGLDFKPFGQGIGTRGLPGDYTPPARFIRALYAKVVMTPIQTLTKGVHEVFHMLASVNIPKGSVVTKEDESDYTQYIACMANNELTYYIQTYYNPHIRAVKLTEAILSQDKVVQYSVTSDEDSILFL